MIAAILICCLAFLSTQIRADLAPRSPFEPDPAQVQHLQRTITLLQSGTPSNRPTVRVLIYGQSHSLTPWWLLFTQGLIDSYPYVNFVVTNKAIIAFEAQELSQTCLTDIGPWQPDLIMLHCFGSPEDHDLLYSRIRSICAADVLVQADHPINDAQITEAIDGSEPGPDFLAVYRNYILLPELANRYGFCWADIRTPWKKYLLENGLPARSLLLEDLSHVNGDGSALQSELLLAFLKRRVFEPPIDPWNDAHIQTRHIGDELHWVDDALEIQFSGNRVDAVYDDGAPEDSPSYRYLLDGNTPSEIPELYGFDRTSNVYGLYWPGILGIENQSPLLEESWTLRLLSMDENGGNLIYSISGSKTGFDGIGTNEFRFISFSGRVVLQPNHVTIGRAYTLRRVHPPDGFEVRWDAVRRFAEPIRPKAATLPGRESVETLFVGATDRSHTLKLYTVNANPRGIKGIRVYSPSGNAQITGRVPHSDPLTRLTVRRFEDRTILTWPLEWGGRIESSHVLFPVADWQKLSLPPSERDNSLRIEHWTSEPLEFYRWLP